MIPSVRSAAWTLFLVFFSVMLPGRATAQTTRPDSLFVHDLIALFETEERELTRFYDLEFSEKRYARLEKFYADWRERIEVVDFDALDRAQRIDWILLRHHLEDAKENLDFARARREEMAPVLPFAVTIVALEEARRAFESPEPRVVAGKLVEIKKSIADLLPRLESGVAARNAGAGPSSQPSGPIVCERVVANQAAGAVDSLRGDLERWYRNFGGYDPNFTWWVKAPFESAVESLRDYAGFLREKIALAGNDALIGRPIGEAALKAALRHEMIAYSPEDLIKLAERHLEWCDAEMKRAAAEMGMGDDWKAALEKVKSAAADPGKQAAYVVEVAKAAIAFCDEKKLVTIPPMCRELWRYEMLSAEGQRFLPFASYDDLWMSVAFPTAEMDHEKKIAVLRGNNKHFTRLVTPHELVPGHHLQGHYAARSLSWRRMFSTPFLVEGWAVYGEMLFWDMGFYPTPEDRIGALVWRIHRCARIIVSLGFHLGRMQPEEMIRFLEERVGFEKDAATAEVRRYISGGYGPLYQCGYLVGALQFRALRKELVESGKMNDREFHDQILEQNSIPVELIRAALDRSRLLSADYEASWKFGEN